MFDGKPRQVGAVVSVGFAQQIADIFFDGTGAEVESFPDVDIRQTMGEEF